MAPLWYSTGQNSSIYLDFSLPQIRLAAAINSLMTLVLGYLLAWRGRHLPVRKAWNSRILFWPFFILLCLLIANILIGGLGKIFSWPGQNALRIIGPTGSGYLWTVLLCLAIGYGEETLFRRAAKDIFWFLPAYIPHIIMSLLFGAAHLGQGWTAMVFSTAAGGIFATFYELLTKKYGQWGWHGISVTHGLYNFLILILASWLQT